ncbi:MAG: S8 family serine peptidase [Bacteroidia bacterium]
MNRFFFLVLSFFALLCNQSSAQNILQLKTGAVILSSNIDSILEVGTLPETALFNQQHYLVLSFNTLPSASAFKQLTASGVTFLDYLPENSYWAAVATGTNISMLKANGVIGINLLEGIHKISLTLQQPPLPEWTITSEGKIKATIDYFSNCNLQDVERDLISRGVSIQERKPHVFQLDVMFPGELLHTIAQLPYVNYIDHATPPVTPDNTPGVNNHRANVLTSAIAGRNLSGQGVSVGIGDGGFVTPHLDFQNRQTNFSGTVLGGWGDHGDHVTGTVGGAGIINKNYMGMAPKATLYAIQSSGFVSNTAYYFNNFGIVLTNNSYGITSSCTTFGLYTGISRILDMQLIASSAVNHIFAASNDGGTSCSPYPAGFATMSQGYGASKNVLTVGAVSDLDALAGFSSRGPCDDGRIKPDICGVGVSVTSTIPNNTYGTKNGTSMATPGVTGTLALIYERYKLLNSGSNPDGALIKAIVMNTADDIGNSGPDFRHGYGRLNAKRAVEAIEAGTFTNKNVSQNDSVTQTITVPSGALQLRVLVYWKDKEGNASANPALVNNVDMHIISPSATIIRPWILDTTAALVNSVAVQGIDNLNNVEQVTINNPAAGNYTTSLIGKSIPFGPQKCFIVWEVIMPSLALTFPAGAEKFSPGSTQRIRFDAYGFTSGNFILEYSINNGTSWSTISNTVSVSARSFDWLVPSAISSNCRVRVRHSTVTTLRDSSLTFTIIGTPSISLASTTTCGNQVLLRWNPIAGAVSYDVMMLNGTSWTTIGNTGYQYYTVTNLSTGIAYWFSLRANGSAGEQSLVDTGISVTVSAAGCNYTSTDGGVSKVLSPKSGRLNSSTKLSSNTNISVEIKNYGTTSIGNFPVHFQVNGGAIITEVFSGSIASNSTASFTFSSTVNLSAIGNYSIKSWTSVTGDTVSLNNGCTSNVRHLDNYVIVLPYSQSFEGATDTIVNETCIGMAGLVEFDYINNNALCRMRTTGPRNLIRTGQKAVFLDKSQSTTSSHTNNLIATLNLSTYTTANNIKFSFSFLHTGEEKNDNDSVWIRGNDLSAWIPIYDLWGNRAAAGTYKNVTGIDISKALANAGQNYSSSFQIRFGQQGNATQRTANDSDGFVFDDILLEDVTNDIQLVSASSPVSGCGLSSATDVSVTIKNNGSTPASNFLLNYTINGTGTVSEIFTPTIAPGNTAAFTFSTKANLALPGLYSIVIWCELPLDGKNNNDTLYNSTQSIELVNTFPYNQSFETTNGNFYTGGTNSSWAWGVPAGNNIDTAANGIKAWVTNLTGDYNDGELSYLYSPCFNLSSLASAVLSFNMTYFTENGYDRIWVEYSENSTTWTKLGISGSGTNWYSTGGGTQVWEGTSTGWSVRSYTIPLGSIVNKTNVRFRIVFSADGSITDDGVGIDDFLIIGTPNTIYSGGNTSILLTSTGSGWLDFISGGQRIASINDNGQNLGNVTVHVGISGLNRTYDNHKVLRRNWAVKTANNPTSTYTVRLYLLNTEYNLLNAADDSISSTHDLGVSKYNGSNEDTIYTNNSGTYTFIPPSSIRKVPFNNGYYLEFTVNSFSEFWVHAGGPNHNTPLPVEWLNFNADKLGEDALLSWTTATEKDNDYFTVELSAPHTKNQFTPIGNVKAAGNSLVPKSYTFTDTEKNKTGLRYYRIKQTDYNGMYSYSAVRALDFTGENTTVVSIQPNPTPGELFLKINGSKAEKATVIISDFTGRILTESTLQLTSETEQKFALQEVAGLKAGIYFVKVNIKTEQYIFKLIKN